MLCNTVAVEMISDAMESIEMTPELAAVTSNIISIKMLVYWFIYLN